jgi:hypothetical protein
LTSVGFFNTDKDRYEPSGGREVKSDGTILDVAAWREEIKASVDLSDMYFPQSQTQNTKYIGEQWILN